MTEDKLKLMSYNKRDKISYVLNINIMSGKICIDHRSFSIFPNGCDECGADPILFQYSLGKDKGSSEDHYCAICIYKQLIKKKL